MKNRLGRILEYKAIELKDRKAAFGSNFVRDALFESPPRGFRAALEAKSADGWPALIAEIKKASPSAGLIRNDFDPPAIADAYEKGGAACLSVLTDAPSFQGCEAHLRVARAACALPVLRKDFMIDPWQVTESRAVGADAILVILAAVDDACAADLIAEARRYSMDVLVECHDEAEIDRAGALGADLIGVNCRDLKTFTIDLSLPERLIPRAPKSALVVAESGVRAAVDVALMARSGARGVLVGESLMRRPDIEAATRTLMKRPS